MEPTFMNIAFIVAAGFLIALIVSSITIAKGNEIITLERLYFGKQMPDGRTVALASEVGVQARVLGPGIHFLEDRRGRKHCSALCLNKIL